MIGKTFKSGNYNSWNRFIKTLSDREIFLKDTIIPTIDNILLKMLGTSSDIEKTLIDIKQVCDRKMLRGVQYKIIYTIKDFMVPEAPAAAVSKDTEALKTHINFDGYKLDNLSINVQNGQLLIELSTFFEGI